MVTWLDRLGRDTRDVLNIVHECRQRGAFLTILGPHVSTRGEMGHIILTVLEMAAQMERRFIKERQRDRIARAKEAGLYKGGKIRLDYDMVRKLRNGGLQASQIAPQLKCSRMQVYRILSSDFKQK